MTNTKPCVTQSSSGSERSRIRRPARPWVGQVFRREDIYSGPLVADAPDIAFLPADMRYLPLGNADFTSNKFMVDAFGISGCHRMNGVMIANGARDRGRTQAR